MNTNPASVHFRANAEFSLSYTTVDFISLINISPRFSSYSRSRNQDVSLDNPLSSQFL